MGWMRQVTSAVYIVAKSTYEGLVDTDTAVEQSFKVTNALAFGAPQRMVERLRRSPAGVRLLREQPDIRDQVCDRDYLQSCPNGSLGRCYLQFMDEEGIELERIVDASEDNQTWLGEASNKEVRWTQQRLRDTHDLWHVVTGFQADLVGEFGIANFAFAQNHHLGMGYIAGVGFVISPKLQHRRRIVEGFVQGLRARFFLAQDWERLLPLPLEEVRRQLNCPPVKPYEALRESFISQPKTTGDHGSAN